MLTKLPDKLEQGRIRRGAMASTPDMGPYGSFMVQGPCGSELGVIAAGGEDTGWEHVSVSTRSRPPNWQEMVFVKDLFWGPEECVMQLHPPRSDYVNCHPYCLHLWRPIDVEIPRPPAILVGPRNEK